MSTARRSSHSSASTKSNKTPSTNTIQQLQTENAALRQEIESLKSIFSVPISDNHRYTHFRYQIYSLEKQVALLTRLLDAKREAVATCETILLELSEFLQNFKGKIDRKEKLDDDFLQNWIDRIESNRKKSFKSMEEHSNLSNLDTLYGPSSNKFVQQEPVHLLDICSGRIEHLNLKNIANLESSLYDLYGELRSFQSELNHQTNFSIFPNVRNDFVQRSKFLSDRIEKTNGELFYLSLLIPTRHQQCSFASETINTDSLCQRINSKFRLSPNIKLFLQSMFDALIACFNHEIQLLQIELKIQNKQLTFYRQTLMNIHCEHIRQLIEILSNGQHSFNKQLQQTLYEPLTILVKEFQRMSEQKTDESLKSFLFTVQIHIDRFNEVIQDLYQQITVGSQSVDQFFIETNEQMWKSIEQEQRKLINQIESIQNQEMPKDSKPFDKLIQLLNLSDNSSN